MNWFTLAGAVLHALHNVPDMVDDIEDFWSKLTGKEPPPVEAQNAVTQAIADVRSAP